MRRRSLLAGSAALATIGTSGLARPSLAQGAAAKLDAPVFVQHLEPLRQRLASGALAGRLADGVVRFAFDFHSGQGSCAQSVQGSSASARPMRVNCSVW